MKSHDKSFVIEEHRVVSFAAYLNVDHFDLFVRNTGIMIWKMQPIGHFVGPICRR